MRKFFFAVLFAFAFVGTVSGQPVTEGAGWMEHAKQYLSLNGSPLVLDDAQLTSLARRLRCVKMNNYVCIMQGSDPWRGSDGIGGNARDGAGHTVFVHPKWSIRAIVRDYCSKARQGVDTALEIAEKYTPWCDTLGTHGVYNGWGRTCNDGNAQPPAGFSGPLCHKPPGNVPLAGQCNSCNCPSINAPHIAASVGLEMTDPLELFSADGTPNYERMLPVVRAKVSEEIFGAVPSDDLLREGIALAGLCTGLPS